MKPAAKPMPEFFISKDGLATFWFWVGFLGILGSAFYTYRLATRAGLRPQFIMLVPENHSIELLPPTQARSEDQLQEMFTAQSRLLMDSIFNKSSIGLDAGDRCHRLMTDDAFAWVETNLLKNQQDAFDEGNLHQKLTIANITVTPGDGLGNGSAVVQGQLLRIGVLRRQLLNQVWTVNARITWSRNTNLRDCGRYPLVCTDFDCNERLTSSSMRDLTRQEQASLEKAGEKQELESKEEKKS